MKQILFIGIIFKIRDLGVIPQKKSSSWYFRTFLAVEVEVSNNFNSLAFAQRERERERVENESSN